ncbi:MAG: hypothetical protein PSX79_10325 [bacterium]|nr:hypothetical protein [bacterium]
MTDTSRAAKLTGWHLEITRKIAASRAQLAADAQERAARPQAKRRTAASPNRRRAAGPADAAEQARQDEHARRLREAKEACLLKMEQTAMDILGMGL